MILNQTECIILLSALMDFQERGFKNTLESLELGERERDLFNIAISKKHSLEGEKLAEAFISLTKKGVYSLLFETLKEEGKTKQ